MQMISMVFLLLTALVLALLAAGNRIFKTEKERILFSKWVLLGSSFLFAAYGDLRFALVLGGLSLVSWFAAKYRKFWKLGVILSLLYLGYFKYSNFFLESFERLFGGNHREIRILLPLGISFYTFSAISYMVDVHRGKLEARNLRDVALYLSFFPKLTSGPIQRCEDFFSQADRQRNISCGGIGRGAQIFAFGLFKKIVLADRLSVFVDQVFYTPMVFDSLTVLLAVIAYALQLYFDFSGYSDLAIGIGEMLDIRLPRNFNLPYLSHNITEFWKRWHITLSSWLQDYLYIPLGGSRRGKFRSYVNLMITMALGGLWHGASLNYVLWGLLNGAALVVHKLFFGGKREKKYNIITNTLSVFLTCCFVCFSWIFFRAETLTEAMTILGRIFSFGEGVRHPYVWLTAAVLIYMVCAAAAVVHSRALKNMQQKRNRSWVQGFYPDFHLDTFWGLTLFFVFCGLILGLAYTGGSPFIYGGY